VSAAPTAPPSPPPVRPNPGRLLGSKSRPRPLPVPSVVPERRYLRLEDIQRRLGLSRAGAYRLVQTKVLKSVTIGRSRRVLESELERFIDQLEAAS
jgi:excisionase family DNA binding protein